jgi:hypothetical protein
LTRLQQSFVSKQPERAQDVFVLTAVTAASRRAGGSRSPGSASPSAIARRICAATCSCRSAGPSRSILTSGIVPVIVARHMAAWSDRIRWRVIGRARSRQRRERGVVAAVAVCAAVVGAIVLPSAVGEGGSRPASAVAGGTVGHATMIWRHADGHTIKTFDRR